MLDGHDVRDVDLSSLRSQVSIVLQDALLFSGSVRENIAYGRPEAAQPEIEAAARAAQAHEFIAKLPQGYETVVGERGVGLSGGQRQRIAIARALLVNPRLLILDDSTSAVDAQTEALIQGALDQLMRCAKRTTFVIAQRISTVREADLILVLDQGVIAASGNRNSPISTWCSPGASAAIRWSGAIALPVISSCARVGNEEIERWRELVDSRNMPQLFERLMVVHYDPAYRRSTVRHFPNIDGAKKIELDSLDPAMLRQVGLHLGQQAL